MKNIEDIVFIVQARTQSTRVPNKMLKLFANTTLIESCIDKVLTSKIIPRENFFLSIMDQELIDVANKYGLNRYLRSEESTQEPVKLQTIFEWYEDFIKMGYKYYVIISACCPLLKAKTIDRFVESFLRSNSRGHFPVFEKRHFIFNQMGERLNTFLGDHDYLVTFETKLLEPYYEAAGTMYAGTLSDIGNNVYMGSFEAYNDPEFFIMDEHECLDIDYSWQFELAEILYMSRNQNDEMGS